MDGSGDPRFSRRVPPGMMVIMPRSVYGSRVDDTVLEEQVTAGRKRIAALEDALNEAYSAEVDVAIADLLDAAEYDGAEYREGFITSVWGGTERRPESTPVPPTPKPAPPPKPEIREIKGKRRYEW